MAALQIDQIRNIALVGHSGCGKTQLAEALLFKTGMTNRLGSPADKTSILDYNEESKEKLSSLDSAVCYLNHGGLHVNIVDTPGTQAFCGPAIAALAAVECAVVCVSASAGVQVNTRKMYERARTYGVGVWFVITHIDSANVDLPQIVSDIQESFGPQCVPINRPRPCSYSLVDCFSKKAGSPDFGDVGAAHTAVIEAVVGADEAMMEKYLGGELSAAEVESVAARAVADGVFMPIFFANPKADVGVTEFLAALKPLCPNPKTGFKRTLVDGENKTTITPDPAGPFIGQVFKITSDPKSNIKYLSIRVHSGTLTSDMHLKSLHETRGTRPGHVMRTFAAEHKDIESGVAGDVIALAKLDFHLGETLFTAKGGAIPKPPFPDPMLSLALESKTRGDEDKISLALKRFADEDPCFRSERGTGGELVVRGMGELQMRTYIGRMAKQYKLEIETRPPRIPYRETVSAAARDIEYTHKKQTGGAGQFGRVVINVLPAARGEGYEFLDKIFGGVIDQSFRPSVDKGVRAQMAEGVLAGYPIVDVKVELIDGKTHPVDSKDIAFQIAGRGAFKDGFMKAKPILLEPIVHIEVTCPQDTVGDITGDLASRRGRPQGQDMQPGNMALIKATVPLAEVADYNSRLSSITGGQGSYSLEFSHYETVPGNVQQQIIDAHKKEREAAAHGHGH